MKAYKVCAKIGRNNYSYTYSGNQDKTSVKYYIGKYTVPKKGCGNLAVFRTLKQAKRFLCEEDNLKGKYSVKWSIFLSEAKKSKEGSLYTRNGTCEVRLFELPDGTILADKVKLIKRVL